MADKFPVSTSEAAAEAALAVIGISRSETFEYVLDSCKKRVEFKVPRIEDGQKITHGDVIEEAPRFSRGGRSIRARRSGAATTAATLGSRIGGLAAVLQELRLDSGSGRRRALASLHQWPGASRRAERRCSYGRKRTKTGYMWAIAREDPTLDPPDHLNRTNTLFAGSDQRGVIAREATQCGSLAAGTWQMRRSGSEDRRVRLSKRRVHTSFAPPERKKFETSAGSASSKVLDSLNSYNLTKTGVVRFR